MAAVTSLADCGLVTWYKLGVVHQILSRTIIQYSGLLPQISNMSLAQKLGAMYCLDATGLRGPMPGLGGMIAPNGTAFSLDGTKAFLSDSHVDVQTVWQFDFDLERGEWAPDSKRVFAEFVHLPGRPDGAAMDADGNYWICANDAALVHCFAPNGLLRRSVPVPVPNWCAALMNLP